MTEAEVLNLIDDCYYKALAAGDNEPLKRFYLEYIRKLKGGR